MTDKPKQKRNRKVEPMDIAARVFKQVAKLEQAERDENVRHKERLGTIKMVKEAAIAELTEPARPLYEALRKAQN